MTLLASLLASPALATAEQWTPTAPAGAPAARSFHTAVWTGSRTIVWGGLVGPSEANTGGIYDPSTDTWTPTGTTGALAGYDHTAVWTGSKMIVWGPLGPAWDYTPGQVYDPSTDSWTPVNPPGAEVREWHTAVWTGSKMIVWGGFDYSVVGDLVNTGGIYDPEADTWTPISDVGAPVGCYYHTAVWTGSKMIVWGGFDAAVSSTVNTGAVYDPATDTWTPMTTVGGPPGGRAWHTAVWTGSKMIVWGGWDRAATTYSNTGWAYDPAADNWTALSGDGAPAPRDTHTAVWTGSKMIVWGGEDAAGELGTGGIYEPLTDTWTAITMTGAPSARLYHTAVWTGSSMVVWGGSDASDSLATGGVYTPPGANLSISKTDGVSSVVSGSPVTYTITVTNAGPGTVVGARVSDVLPAALQDASWTCAPTGSGGVADCAATGSGDIDDTVTLGAGESVVYTLEATASGSGSLVNTATVTAPGDSVDPDPSDDTATDTDSIVPPPAPSALAISDVELVEGNSGTATATLTVTLSPPSPTTVTVSWVTASGTAAAGTDFDAATGSLTFVAGETTKTVALSVRGDTQIEGDEAFTVDLSGASGAAIDDDQGQVTILNDDSATSAPPFGYVDTPADGATGIEGAIAVTGWALDDTGVLRVVVSRDPVAGEPAGSRIYVGDTTFVSGARPDVAAAFPAYPNPARAGWGLMLLTNMLPNQGNGTFKLWLHAIDREGHEALLGTRTITCANAAATLPFGTIDTPAPGATVGGSTYVVFGWALTPLPGAIPLDGSTIWVFVDGVPVGHPVYDNYRSDVATLFPGYANSSGAVGYYVLDTTKLANGIHTIAWSVTDDRGRTAGIGSRYFWVSNVLTDEDR